MPGSVLLPALASIASIRLGTVATRPLRPAALRRLERLALAALAGLTIAGAASLTLALIGIWSGPLLLGLLLAAWLALEVLDRRRPREPAAVPAVWGDGAVALACALLLVAALPAFPALLGGRDYGTYTATGELIRLHGGIQLQWPPLQGVPPAARAAFGVPDPMPGFYLDRVGGDSVTPQGFHALPALLAASGAVSGDTGLWLIPVIAVLGLLATALLAMRLARSRASVAGAITALLLLTDVAWFWYARMPMTETLATTLVLGGLWLWVVAHDTGSVPAAALAGVAVGASLFTRPDAFIAVPAVAAVLAWLIVAGRADRRVWTFAAAFGALTALGAVYVALRGRRYVTDILHQQYATTAPTLGHVMLLLAAGSAVLLALAAGIRRLAGGAIERHAATIGRVLVVLVAVAVVGYGLAAAEAHWLGVRWLRWYLSSVAVVAGGIGFVAMVGDGLRRDRLLRAAPLVVLAGGLTAQYGRSPTIFADQFWGIRRFLAVPIPAIAIFTACLVALVLASGRRLRIPAGIALGLVLVVALVHQARDLRPVLRHREFAGAAAGLQRVNGLVRGADHVIAGPGEVVKNRIGIGLIAWHRSPVLGAVGRLDTGPSADWLAAAAGRSDIRLLAADGELPALDLSRVRLQPVGSTPFAISEFDQTVGGIPSHAHELAVRADVFRLVPAARDTAARPPAVDLATAPVADVTGFAPAADGTRSVAEAGQVLVGGDGGRTLHVTLAAPAEPGVGVIVRADGAEVGRATAGATPQELTFPLPAAAAGPVSVGFEVTRAPGAAAGPGVAVQRVAIGP